MRTVIGSLLVGASLLLAGCGSSGGERQLTGVHRTPPLQVAGVSVNEVAPGSGPFETVASAPDRLLIVYFGYTNCPDICPTTFEALRTALKDVGTDAERIDVAFITVDPARDTPEVMSGYLGSFFGDRWHALSTDDPSLLAAAEEPFLASSSVGTTFDGRISVTHTGTTYVIDSTGQVLVEWGFPTEPDDMSADLRQLLKESA